MISLYNAIERARNRFLSGRLYIEFVLNRSQEPSSPLPLGEAAALMSVLNWQTSRAEMKRASLRYGE